MFESTSQQPFLTPSSDAILYQTPSDRAEKINKLKQNISTAFEASADNINGTSDTSIDTINQTVTFRGYSNIHHNNLNRSSRGPSNVPVDIYNLANFPVNGYNVEVPVRCSSSSIGGSIGSNIGGRWYETSTNNTNPFVTTTFPTSQQISSAVTSTDNSSSSTTPETFTFTPTTVIYIPTSSTRTSNGTDMLQEMRKKGLLL
jgi:hypothetical protein